MLRCKPKLIWYQLINYSQCPVEQYCSHNEPLLPGSKKKKEKKKIIKHVSLHGLITRLVFFFFEVHEERSSFSDKDFCDEEKQKRC